MGIRVDTTYLRKETEIVSLLQHFHTSLQIPFEFQKTELFCSATQLCGAVLQCNAAVWGVRFFQRSATVLWLRWGAGLARFFGAEAGMRSRRSAILVSS